MSFVTPDIIKNILSFINLPLTIGVQWNLTLFAYLWRIMLPGT
jgi:hypothetical protein